MPLLNLPNELLLYVADNLRTERNINAFARTSRRLYNLLNTYLYRHNVKRFEGSALLWALEHGRQKTAQKLIGEGANVQVTYSRGWTPLLFAATYGYTAVVEMLLANEGIDPNCMNNLGQTPLLQAARHGHEAVVQLLLTKDGIHPNLRDNWGWTPLCGAAYWGHKSVVKPLLSKCSVDVDSKNHALSRAT